MQDRQVDVPYLGRSANARGLGWAIYDLDGGPVIATMAPHRTVCVSAGRSREEPRHRVAN